ncbi:MAG: tetratricopeptide repeat protein [Treponema sp.]|jgi:tetratricopeptide (TPR) repeat protein|nr:tetratricopeptide repeat protein [Treponema sp.]
MDTRHYYDQGWEFIRKNDYAAAIETFNTALAEAPDSYIILEARGGAYQHIGEKEKALADYTRMIELAPKFPDGWNCRGNLYRNLGEYDKAIADFTQCIPMSPDNYGTYWSNRGISYYEKGDLDAALADFNKSLECWKDPECSTWALFNRGLVWREKGDLDKALADFTLAAARKPDDDELFYHAGYICFMQKDYEKAIGWFSKAIAMNGNEADYWLSRGVCYWNKSIKDNINFWGEGGEIINQAEEDFTKAIECAPGMADAYLNRGTVRCSKARESRNLIKAIILEKVTDEATRVLLMTQLGRTSGKDLIPQFDAILRGLRSNRDETEEIVAKFLVLFENDDAREAVEDLSRAIELDPNNADAWYERGLAWTLLGERDKAIQDYEQACALDPNHKKAAAKRDELLENGN